MADQQREAGPGAAPEFAEGLARDWATLWQSELAALSSDREVAEAWGRMDRFWAGRVQAWQEGTGQEGIGRKATGHDGTGAAAPAGAAAADAAPDAAAELARLAGRIAELERRLDRLERGRPEPG